MGNTKSYGFEMPLLDGENPPLPDWFGHHARSEGAVVGVVTIGGERHVIGRVISSSQVADEFIARLREQYPNRWLHVERFDADWSDFRVIDFNEDGTKQCFVADNWRRL